MTLREFTKKNKIYLPEKVYTLCGFGLEIMSVSKDSAVHDLSHIERILQSLDELLKDNHINENDLTVSDFENIDFDELLTAICWHDVWRSTKDHTDVLKLLYHQYMDGLGSVSMFRSKAQELKFENDFIDSVCYAIRKHSQFQFTKLKTIESIILKDLDNLDQWSLVRLDKIKEKYIPLLKKNPGLVSVGRFYYKNVMLKGRVEKEYRLEWSRNKAEELRGLYTNEVEETAKNLGYKL